jgi:high affinity Mn2+ porin
MRSLITTILLFSTIQLWAQDSSQSRFNIHFQTTYIYQYKPSFHSDYESAHSLSSKEEKQNSITATMYLGARLWKGAAFYFNPEIAGGSGLSGASGMGGSTNGETFRVGDPSPTLYVARAYLTQIFALGKNSEQQDDAANQIAVKTPVEYVKIMAGKFSLADIFDTNPFSNSPRTQFINWALMNNGAWDFAANVRGYTYIVAGIVHKKEMTYKLAFAALPKTANGAELQTNVGTSYSVNAEISHSFRIKHKAANVSLLAYYNNAPMGNYTTALQQLPFTPDIVSTRKSGAGKFGLGLNADYKLNDNWGLFSRIGWNDGKNETWCFTEIDRTISLGLSIDGKKWHRNDDQAGIAIVANGLSKSHKDYLAAGGSGFVLGDGALSYAAETIAELYYNFKPSNIPLYISGDYQFCMNPGYNTARGPLSVFSLRAHVEL